MSDQVDDGSPPVSTAGGSLPGMRIYEAVGAAVVGNILEWYDFAVYGFTALIIAKKFFPTEDDMGALLATFAAFGVGFVARPIGGVLVGRMGDVKGRKAALILTIVMMAVGTVGIGFIPSYASIGIAAPILLVICRLLQGFSTGGEWGGATAFIVEWAPANRRGFFGSFQQASVACGTLLGSGVAAVFNTLLSTAQMESWGWRLPFILGFLLLPVGLYMRRNIGETPAYRKAVEKATTTEVAPVHNGPLLAAKAFGFTVLWTVSYYIMLYYMPTFTQKFAGLGRTEALWSNTIALLLLMVTIPAMGLLSDRIGRKPLLLACCLAFAVLTYPLFSLMLSGATLVTVIIIQVIFDIMISLFSGPGPAAIAEIFPTRSRSTWMSTGYSLAVAIFGGFAPYISTWLIKTTGTPIAPTFYLIAAAVVSAVVILGLKETAHRDLR